MLLATKVWSEILLKKCSMTTNKLLTLNNKCKKCILFNVYCHYYIMFKNIYKINSNVEYKHAFSNRILMSDLTKEMCNVVVGRKVNKLLTI